MFHMLKRQDKAKMPSNSDTSAHLSKPLSAIAVPGMYLFYKYSEFKRQQQESHRKKVTEKELDHLNHKIKYDVKGGNNQHPIEDASQESRNRAQSAKDKLLAKIDDKDGDESLDHSTQTVTTDITHTLKDEEECVICMSAKATMQTFPCGHKVICRKCFIKTIQVAVSQRCLPLKCVICRTRILKLRQATMVKLPTTKGQRSRSQSGLTRFTKQSKVYAK